MPSETLRVGLLQTSLVWEDVEANCTHFETKLPYQEQLDLLLLPEMWSTGFSMRPHVVAEHRDGPAITWMKEHSQKLNAVIAGSISVEENGRYYNRLYFVHPEGRIDQYDKRHLFSYGKEDQHYTQGKQRPIIEINGWRILPVICYDLRFPVWCRNNNHYDVMVVVANWPAPRIHHWDALLKARAIENQSYIAAVNRTGSDANGNHYPGHSSIYDMNGNILLDMKDTDGVGMYTLDQNALTQYREHFRFLPDRDTFSLIME